MRNAIFEEDNLATLKAFQKILRYHVFRVEWHTLMMRACIISIISDKNQSNLNDIDLVGISRSKSPLRGRLRGEILKNRQVGRRQRQSWNVILFSAHKLYIIHIYRLIRKEPICQPHILTLKICMSVSFYARGTLECTVHCFAKVPKAQRTKLSRTGHLTRDQ